MRINRKLINRVDYLLSREKGTVYKEHGGRVRVCLIYPNTYHIGMSNLGFRIIYSLLNNRDDVVCERAFLPDPSDINEYDRTGTEIFCMESKKSLINSDILAFSVSFENDYLNILKILKLSKIPIYSSERDEYHPLLIMGGPCAFMNPEPLSPFFDIVFVGEAEVLIDDFIDFYKESSNKKELYNKLSDSDGFYVPRFYEIKYSEDGKIKERISKNSFPEKIQRRYLENLDKFSHVSQIITDETEFSNMYLIEAMRGCPWNCRFCAAGKIYDPPRKKGYSEISKEINVVNKLTEKVGIIGPSLTDYPFICNILSIEGVEFSISSLRASIKSGELLSLIKNKRSISIAPEAGSERLRRVINKKISREDILDTSRLIFKEVVETLKLYFMVGLPTETDEDIKEIIDLVKEIRGLSISGNIVLSVSTFVPKPFTAFQWYSMEEVSVEKKRLKMLKKQLEGSNISVFHDVPKYAYLQGLFAKGDSKLSKVLESMLSINDWKKACEASEIDPDFYISRKKDFDEILPWDFIDNGIDKRKLWDEYKEALNIANV